MGMNYEGVRTFTWTRDACGSAWMAFINLFPKILAAKATASNLLAISVINIASVTLKCAIVKIFIAFRKKLYIAAYRNWSILSHERKLISKCQVTRLPNLEHLNSVMRSRDNQLNWWDFDVPVRRPKIFKAMFPRDRCFLKPVKQNQNYKHYV